MVCVGFCRPRVGTILAVNGAVLGYVGTFCFMFWQFWALFGYAALGLCLPDLGLLLGHSRLFQRPVGLMLNHVAVSCGCVSFSLGTSWDHIGFVLGHIKPCWHHIELTLNHFALFFGSCFVHARRLQETP